jgi:hypothetical protein
MKCIRLRKYNHGEGDLFAELFHEHFPAHRIGHDAQIEMMKALVLRYEEEEASYILRCYLNKRGHDPEPYDPFRFQVDLKDGVMRMFCGGTSGTDIQAWLEYRV